MTLRRSPPCGASSAEEPTANAVLMVSEALAFTGRTSWADVVRAYRQSTPPACGGWWGERSIAPAEGQLLSLANARSAVSHVVL